MLSCDRLGPCSCRCQDSLASLATSYLFQRNPLFVPSCGTRLECRHLSRISLLRNGLNTMLKHSAHKDVNEPFGPGVGEHMCSRDLFTLVMSAASDACMASTISKGINLPMVVGGTGADGPWVPDNEDSCTSCGAGGALLCCDGCPAAFHLACVGLRNAPPGQWLCAVCMDGHV